jgi:hypothetical protein
MLIKQAYWHELLRDLKNLGGSIESATLLPEVRLSPEYFDVMFNSDRYDI